MGDRVSSKDVQVFVMSITWFLEEEKCQHLAQLEEQKEIVTKAFSKYAKHWVWQIEETPTTKRFHVQGYINLHMRNRPRRVAKLLSAQGMKGVTVKRSSTKGQEALRMYCMKEDTRIHGPYADRVIYNGQDLPLDLYPWQQTVVREISEKPDDRTINWIYDTVGNTGKSKLAKYLAVKCKAAVFPYMKVTDMQYQIVKKGARNTYIFDLTRCKPADVSSKDLYVALEDLKNGAVHSGKYDGGDLYMESPHVYVLCNYRPETKLLSMDRWKIREIHDKCIDQIWD